MAERAVRCWLPRSFLVARGGVLWLLGFSDGCIILGAEVQSKRRNA